MPEAASNRKSTMRLILTAVVAFTFYFSWSYWANSLVSDDMALVLRSAFVQGIYSGGVTLLFTWILEHAIKRFGDKCLSLFFVVPVLCAFHSKTTQNLAIRESFNSALDRSATLLKGNFIPGALIAPLIPLAVQSVLVIGVNVINQTPNLWLTVAPSILFSGIYGYLYTMALTKRDTQ